MASVQDRQEGIIVKLFDLVHEADSYQPPELSVGDRILKGKFKNSPAEITGFTKDKHNQPVLKTDRGEVQLFKPRVVKLLDKDVVEDRPIPKAESGKAIALSNLGKFHAGVDTLGKWVPERLTHQFALDPDKWEHTFYSLTLKEPKKIRYYRPKNVDILPGTLVGDMAIANQFYRTKDPVEQEKYALAYLASLKPYPVNLDDYKFPELLIPRKEQGVAEGALNEGLAHPVIVVDVQPEYSGMNDGDESSVFPQIINFVNNQTGPVLMFVNAEDQGLSGDTIQDIKQYWDDTICPEEERYTHDEETDDYIENSNCPRINWQRFAIADKGYGYFRSWMDHGIEPATIIATIRELYQQKKNDSRELQFPAFNRRTPQQSLIMGAMQEMEDDPISVNWTSVAQLKRFNGAYIVGGARDQCLREVELLMNAFNIKYKRIDSLIYEGRQGVAEGKIKLYTDPDYFGAEVDDTGFDSLPVVKISADRLVGFEPDDKMKEPTSRANVKKILAGIKQGDKLPPLLVRKYKDGYQVLDGHHRFWAYKLSGTKSIPVRIVADKDIEEISKPGAAEGTSPKLSAAPIKIGSIYRMKVNGSQTYGKVASINDDRGTVRLRRLNKDGSPYEGAGPDKDSDGRWIQQYHFHVTTPDNLGKRFQMDNMYGELVPYGTAKIPGTEPIGEDKRPEETSPKLSVSKADVVSVQGVAEGASNNLQTIIKSFVDSPNGQKYKKYDCKTVTRAFVQWAEQNKIPTQVVLLAPPSADFIAKNPQFQSKKGKPGEGDSHIMPIVNGEAIDFTVRQFGVSRPFENPLLTSTDNLQSVYGKFGYFTDNPDWFAGGKSLWIGALNAIPPAILNQNFGDEMLEHTMAEDREYIPSGKERITRNGIDLVVGIDGATVDIRAMTGDSQMAYVVFDRDGDTLVADDLAVEEQYKGQGIAKIMYDYVKELGFRVKRSSDQLVAGKKFWDKNKGAENNIWEQGVAEGLQNIEIQDDKSIVTISIGGKERFVLQPATGHKLKSYGGRAYKYWTIYDIERKKDRFNPNIGMMSKNQAIAYVNKIIQHEEDAAKEKPGVAEDLNQTTSQLGPQLYTPHPKNLDESMKPKAALWTSTASGGNNGYSSAWVEWAKSEMPQWVGHSGFLYDVSPNARILTINSDRDAMRVAKKYGMNTTDIMDLFMYMPWKKIAKDYDAIHHVPSNRGADIFMHSWDVESTAWFNTKMLLNKRKVPILASGQGMAEGTEKVNPLTKLTNAVISFYNPVVDQIEPGAVDNYDKQAKELLNQAPDPTIRSRMREIFQKGQKDPMIQGGVITAIAAILTGGLLSSASRMGLSPAQTNILLQAVLNTVIPTIIARINNKSWRDTIKYTLASVGVGMTAAATLSEKRVTEGLSIDVPNEEWLQDKIDYAKSKGRDEWGAPFFGTTTAYARPNPQVSVVRLELLKGMRNEQNNVRKTDLEWLMAHMEKTSKLPLTNQGEEYAPFVMVAYNGEAWVSEGNHRIMAAYRLGWKKMPIEIKYFDGGERVQDGIMYPGKIGLGQPAAKPVREAYTGPQLKWIKPGELRGSYTDQQLRDRGFNRTGTGKWFILLSRWNELIAKKEIQ